MIEKLDPFSESFLRTCYREGVPPDTAYLMLVKAATNNARQSALLPIGNIGSAVLFQHGRRVADLALKESSTQLPMDLSSADARMVPPNLSMQYKQMYQAAKPGNGPHTPAFFNNITRLKQTIGKQLTWEMLRRGLTQPASLPTRAQMAASPIPATA